MPPTVKDYINTQAPQGGNIFIVKWHCCDDECMNPFWSDQSVVVCSNGHYFHMYHVFDSQFCMICDCPFTVYSAVDYFNQIG